VVAQEGSLEMVDKPECMRLFGVTSPIPRIMALRGALERNGLAIEALG